MNKELKDLLYSSLCSYFPYGIMIQYPDPFTSVMVTEELKEISKLDTGIKSDISYNINSSIFM